MAIPSVQPAAAPANPCTRVAAQEVDLLNEYISNLETMILTLDASQLFDHAENKESIALGSAMFMVIVDRVLAHRRAGKVVGHG